MSKAASTGRVFNISKWKSINPLKQNRLKRSHGAFRQTKEAVCFQGGVFAHASGLQMTCQDGTCPFSVWPPLSEGKVWRFPACLSTVRVFALLIRFQMGVFGSKHDSANRQHYRSFVSLFSPPDCELCHIQRNLVTQFPRRGSYFCYIGTHLRR